MILTCPNCGTQYVVKDGAIPPEGRQVRCASCKHSWHQDPEEGADQDEPPWKWSRARRRQSRKPLRPKPSEAEPAEEDESLAEATLIEPRSGPEAEERAYEEAVDRGRGRGRGGTRRSRGGGRASRRKPPRIEIELRLPRPRSDWASRPQPEAAGRRVQPYRRCGRGSAPASQPVARDPAHRRTGHPASPRPSGSLPRRS